MYDILIKNGKIIDGQNSAPYFADVAIQGDEIVKIGKIDEPAGRAIDAAGKIVTPGFMISIAIRTRSYSMTPRIRCGFGRALPQRSSVTAAYLRLR